MPRTRRLPKSVFCLWFLFILIGQAACRPVDEQQPAENLVELDSMAYRYPRYVYNVVNNLIKQNQQTGYDRAYTGLILSVAAENMGRSLPSDSMITATVNAFSMRPEYNPGNYLRALIYQGITRFHTGIADNRAYLPIKEALILSETTPTDQKTLQIACYYLGVIHTKNNNVNQAHEYFKKAFVIAENLKDSVVLFKTCREMYWNRMKALDFLTARTLLETLQSFSNVSPDQIRDIRNAEAIYYNSLKRYRTALKIDYNLLRTDIQNKDSSALLADYYRISDNYKFMNQPDSALHYGELATRNIRDTTFYLNYYYYLNVAELASQLKMWDKSTAAYQQVYRLMNKTINNQLNTQIMELERKYDVASAENRAIKLKNNNIVLRLVLIILTMGLIITLLIFRNRSRLQMEQQKSLLQEKKILEQKQLIAEANEKQMMLDKQLTERKLIEKQFVIPIYRQISQRNNAIKNFLLDLQSNSYITKNPQILQKIENEYRDFVQTTRVTEPQFLTDELFSGLTGISTEDSGLFNESEKMMLAFMATGSDNQQMATLMNTSVESIRVRKSKLKKKMQENKVKIPKKLEADM
ncbi:MAG TPA: hypothetical protein PKH58_04605 [Paludibacteraceae bacterium]|nr:hypothetical protein [Paludibacteraceae bacterium]HPT42960.1 hypothetical protein [Paludibacteraceae bacterium]